MPYQFETLITVLHLIFIYFQRNTYSTWSLKPLLNTQYVAEQKQRRANTDPRVTDASNNERLKLPSL